MDKWIADAVGKMHIHRIEHKKLADHIGWHITFDSSTSSVVIGTVPSGCNPSAVVRTLCQGTGYSEWLMTVNTSGNISVSRYRSGGTSKLLDVNQWLPMHIVYLVG